MSCSPFDLRDYLFGELPPADGRQVELHLAECPGCAGEMERLRLTAMICGRYGRGAFAANRVRLRQSLRAAVVAVLAGGSETWLCFGFDLVRDPPGAYLCPARSGDSS